MISAPRIRPLARPISASTPETIFVTKPSATAGDVSSAAVFASCSASSSTSELVDRLLDRCVDGVADLVRLLDHAPDGRDDDQRHQREQPEDDEAGAERGFQPAAFEALDRGLEDHRQNRGEQQREHDLAHRREGGEHDDRRDDDADEAPGPDAELGGGAHPTTTLLLWLLIQGRGWPIHGCPDIIQTG